MSCRAGSTGFDEVEWLVIDDGSTDRTVEVARASGVDHIVRLTNNKGLAAAFQAGIDASLKLGADVIVNTDADHQYQAGDIPRLVKPILEGRADMVVGDRQVKEVEHFSASKKLLQRLGSWVVRRASGTTIPDTTSGFRAYNREAALPARQVVSNYTYTLESLIQAGKMLVALEHVPISTNPKTRDSRLVDSTARYVRRNALAVFRAYVLYEPLRVFTVVAIALRARRARRLRPLPDRLDPERRPTGHIQSLILGAMLALTAVQMFGLGIVGDALAGQRVIAQRTFERVRQARARGGHRAVPLRAGRRAHRRQGRGPRPGVREPPRAGPKRGRRLSATAASPAQAGGNVYDKYGTAQPNRAAAGGRVHPAAARARGPDRRGRRARGRLRRGRAGPAPRGRGLRVRGTDASAEVIAEARAAGRGGRGRPRSSGPRRWRSWSPPRTAPS